MFHIIPQPLRKGLIRLATGKLAFALTMRRQPKKGAVAVVGLFRSVIGLGEGARLAITALRKLRINASAVDITSVLQPQERLDTKLQPSSDIDAGGILIVYVNPPEFPIALLAIGRRALRRKRIVGYWHWELPEIPKSWRASIQLVDEIWAPSHFVAAAISRHATVPVYIVPHPVRRPLPSQRNRATFDLSDDEFVCLCAFDMRSSHVRKNPIGAIRAFRKAFGTSRDAMFLLKTAEPECAPSARARIMAEIGQASNIRIIDVKLPTEDMAALINCSDVVISLHRSEGFGLVLAEAMLLGKPVVATGWSGNMDFMDSGNAALVDYTLVPAVDEQGVYTMTDQQWAEPDVAQAAAWLRVLKDDAGLRRKIGMVAARDAAEFFKLERYRAALEATGVFDWLSAQTPSESN
jgi:glycosyltransferase involved in cell wall biosynthesis